MSPSPAIAGSGWEQAVTVPVAERWPGKLRAYGNLGVGRWPPCSLGFREDICVSRMFGAERIMEQKLESPGWRPGMADRSVWLKWARKGGRGKKREAEEVRKAVTSNRPWESVEEFLLGQ